MRNLIQKIAEAFKVSNATGVTVIDGKKGERREMYLRANANGYGQGVKRLVDANLNKEAGVTNFENKDMLPSGKDWLVLGVRISYDTTASATPKTATYGKTAGLPAFVNGELKIEQDGTLLDLPIRACSTNAEQEGFGNNGERYYEVAPFQIKNGKAFGITVEPVGAIAVNQNFEIALDVVEISTSAKVSSDRSSC